MSFKCKWNTLPLSNFIQFKNGKKRPEGTGEIPVYGGNGILDYTNIANQQNGIIIGRVGAYCGSVFYEAKQHWVSDNAISAVNKDNSDIIFDYYLLKNLKLNHRHIGTSQPLLTQEILNSIEVLFPPLVEQIEIGQILRALDDKITNNTIKNHHLTARSAMDNSPDIRRGKRVSRASTSCTFSPRLCRMESNIGATVSVKLFTTS